MFKKMVWLIVSFLAVAINQTFADAQIGQDYLALQHKAFNIPRVLKYTPTGTPLGVLDYTFGESLSPVRSALSTVRPSLLRVHIFNGPGLRNRALGRYDPLYGNTLATFEAKVKRKDNKILSFLRERVLIYKRIQTEYPQTKLVLSPILEHNLSKEAWSVLADATLDAWDTVQLVNSPVGSGVAERYRGAWIERHGSTPDPTADLFSLDGADATDIDIEKYIARTKNGKVTFIWSRGYNCRTQGEFEDPRARDACPSSNTFNLLNKIADKRPAPFTYIGGGCRVINAFDSRYIWKPLSEDEGNDDIRANYPVVIVPGKSSRAIALDFKGNKVGTLGYFGTFPGDRYRYYSSYPRGSKYGGYAFEKKAIASSGSPYVFIQVGRNCFGPMLGGRRQGDMRSK